MVLVRMDWIQLCVTTFVSYVLFTQMCSQLMYMISHTFDCIHCTKVSDLVESTTSSTGENTTEANNDGCEGCEG